MTTRSKKRLQTSLGENSDIPIPKSERKTRSQRIKDEEFKHSLPGENSDINMPKSERKTRSQKIKDKEFNHSLPKPEKRNNVSYPSTNEEIKVNDVNEPIVPHKHERKILRSTLKEKETDSAVDTNDNERKTRRSPRLNKQSRKSIDKQSENNENVTEVDNKNIIVANAESNKKQVLKKMKGKDKKISKTAEALPDFIPEVDIEVPLSLKTSNEQSVKRCNSKKVFDDTDMMETDDIITDKKNNHYNKADQISLQPVNRSKVCKNNQDSNTVTNSNQISTEKKKHCIYVKVCKSDITQNQNNITVNDEHYNQSLSPFVSHPEIIDNKSGELNALKTKTSEIIKSVDISREEKIDDKENKSSIKKSHREITPSTHKKAKNTSFATTEVKSLIYNEHNENSPNNNFDSKSESNRQNIKNSTYDKIDVITPELNSTYDKYTSSVIIHNNTTYDKDDVRNSLSIKPVNLNDQFDKIPDTGCSAINEINEKKSLILGTISENSTFDHQINLAKHCIGERFKNDENLNNTGVNISLDKDHNPTQSSLISSDASTTARNITEVPGTRKRSRSHSAVQELAKHTKLTEELQHSVNRLSRPKNNINGKQPGATTPNRKIPKCTSSSDTKDRRKARVMPNFAALHRKNFDKMESIADFQERKANRASRLLTPTGKLTVLERSPRDEMDTQEKLNKAPEEPTIVPTLMSLRPGYTRFGFKLEVDVIVNPFTVTIKPEVKTLKKTELKRPPTMPSLSGVKARNEFAKNTVIRKRSFMSTTEKREGERKKYRSIIKGVRSNKRFELQMKLRDINN